MISEIITIWNVLKRLPKVLIILILCAIIGFGAFYYEVLSPSYEANKRMASDISTIADKLKEFNHSDSLFLQQMNQLPTKKEVQNIVDKSISESEDRAYRRMNEQWSTFF